MSQHAILMVDDEPSVLKAFQRALRKEPYTLFTAESGADALNILEAREVSLIISDYNMPGMNGLEFLKAVKADHPHILGIMLTGQAKVEIVMEAINEGHLYKFFLKPWNDQNLKLEIRQAMEQYDLVQDNKRLHDQVLQQNQELKRVNENLENIILERTRNLEFQNRALQVSHAILDDLPVPIMGISSEMMVVMANKALHRRLGGGHAIQLGGNVNEFFDADVRLQVGNCLTTLKKCTISGASNDGRSFKMELIPLTGRYQGQGVIMTLSAAAGAP
jgi:response regulator RpfG family c-di-GMP phosphodiesterase